MSTNSHSEIVEDTVELTEFHDEKSPYIPIGEQIEQAVKTKFGEQAELIDYETGHSNHFGGQARGSFTTTYYFVKYKLNK